MATSHYGIPRHFRARVNQTKVGAADRIGKKRSLKHKRRKQHLVARAALMRRQSTQLLEALSPTEDVPSSSIYRVIDDATRVQLNTFSLVDDPAKTMEGLAAIAYANRMGKNCYIDFRDNYCLDIGPYLIFGLMRQEMEPICNGGEIKPRVSKVLNSVGMNQFLQMRLPSIGGPKIFPFPLSRRSAVERYVQGFESHHSAKEKHARRFAESLDSWLGVAQVELSRAGGDYVRSMIAEILDNSRHANSQGDDGEWAIAGFMEIRKDDDDRDIFVCHLAIASIGLTISQTLSRCEDARVQKELDNYIDAHLGVSNRFNADTLRSLCALTDRVSCEGRLEEMDLGGCGMSSLVVMLQSIGSAFSPEQEPRISIISGSSCIQMWSPYNRVISKDPHSHGPYFQPFNHEGKLALPPDDDYVYEIKQRFPGTVIALRFFIRPEELRQRLAEGERSRKR